MEALEDRDWRRLVHTIQRGNCILLLGPDAATDANDPEGGPLAQRLAETLAAKLDRETRIASRDDLPSVAQVFEAARGRVELEMEVEDFCHAFDQRTTPLHERLAALPFALYINTAPDPALVNALRAAGREPRIAHYDFKRTRGFDLPAPTPEHPWVYDLYGSLAALSFLVCLDRARRVRFSHQGCALESSRIGATCEPQRISRAGEGRWGSFVTPTSGPSGASPFGHAPDSGFRNQ